MYTYLMEKYKWKPSDVDDLEVEKTLNLEFGNWNKKAKEQQDNMLTTIDTIAGF